MAAVGGTVLLIGLFTGAASADTQQAASVDLSYSCAFPSANVPTTVHVTATFPTTAADGQPVKPKNLTVAITVPATGLTDLTKAGAASVSGQVELVATATQGAASTKVPWSGLAVPATSVPAKGALTLTASGTAAPLPVTNAGDLTVAAGDLGLGLLLSKADGSATTPGALALGCQPTAGHSPVLATVLLPSGSQTPVSPPSSAAPTTGSTVPVIPIVSGKGSKIETLKALARGSKAGGPKDDGDPPPWCTDYQAPPDEPYPVCAYIVGFSNVFKLHGAAELGSPSPAEASLATEEPTVVLGSDGFYHIITIAHGLITVPPSKATFLAFGFMPVTATMNLTQVGPVNIDSDITLDNALVPETTTVNAQDDLRVSDVMVNGQPLNVGSDCHTSSPLNLALTGYSPSSADTDPDVYTLTNGGPLSGTMTIPKFTGCGVGENLDPLFNGMISGTNNFVKMTQGTLCFAPYPGSPADACPPTVPIPRH